MNFNRFVLTMYYIDFYGKVAILTLPALASFFAFCYKELCKGEKSYWAFIVNAPQAQPGTFAEFVAINAPKSKAQIDLYETVFS